MATPNCEGCDAPLVAPGVWAKLVDRERTLLRERGAREATQGKWCRPCWRRSLAGLDPAGEPARSQGWDRAWNAWMLAGKPPRTDPRFALVAHDLGIQKESLVRALRRAGVEL